MCAKAWRAYPRRSKPSHVCRRRLRKVQSKVEKVRDLVFEFHGHSF